jgi:amidase
VAVAAGYVPFAVGTETNGSIICPASYNGIVGIKPTVGLVSRRGIVPISHSQDTAGPMAHNVRSAALLLSAMEGEDVADSATLAARPYFGRDYVAGLGPDGLDGLRLGVVRSQNFGDGSELAFAAALETLAAAGAVLVDDLAFPDWPEDFWGQSYLVLVTEFKQGLNDYLASLPGYQPAWTLQRLVDFNEQQAKLSMPWFGQSIFLDALAAKGLEDEAYQQALLAVQSHTRQVIDDLLEEYQLDALVAPTNALAFSIDLIHGDSWHGGTSSMSAISGYPHITVPAGRVKGMPAGLSFMGAAFSEPVLIRAAYAYEQAAAQ